MVSMKKNTCSIGKNGYSIINKIVP